MQAVSGARGALSCVEACEALGVARASYYRAQGRVSLEEPASQSETRPRKSSPRALTREEEHAVLDVLQPNLVKRGVSLKVLDTGDTKSSGKEYRQASTLKEGLDQENAKKISKIIRDEGPKGVKAQIQGDELRVSSKKRDDLQAVIALVKGQDYDFAVQFTNYR